jgi:hypothetical protein
MTPAYPKRPPMFAMKAVRLMVKTCLAQRLGADGVMLLTVIASTEDAAHYRRPVDYWNEQIAPLCGFTVSKFRRVRDKCVESGWLAYVPGSKSKAAQYWLTIPEYAEGLDDAPTDEGHDAGLLRTSAQESQDSSAPVCRNPAGIRQECAQESGRNVRNILPVPDPVPDPKEIPPTPTGIPEDFDQITAEATFIANWNKTPGTVPYHRSALPHDLSRDFTGHIANDPGWLHRARDALGRFPLHWYVGTKSKMSLTKFLKPTTVDEILAGSYDSAGPSGRSGKSGRNLVGPGDRFDESTVDQKVEI